MAAQNQSQQENEDSILEQLDEVNEELNQKEEEKKARQEQKVLPKSDHKKKYITYAVLAALGITLGLGIHTIVADRLTSSYSYSGYSTEVIKKQPDYDESTAVQLYRTAQKGQYTFNGESYDLNSTIATFEKNGWKIDSSETVTQTLVPDQKAEYTMTKGDYRIYKIGVTNDTKQDISLENAALEQVYCFDDSIQASGPFGFKSGMSEDEVKKVFADNNIPYSISKYSETTSYDSELHGTDENGIYVALDINISVYQGQASSFDYYLYQGGDSQVITFR